MTGSIPVNRAKLPGRATEIIREYDRRIGIRGDFLWQWIYDLLPAVQLSCLPERYIATAREQKLIFTIFLTTLDDIAENDRDKPTFEQARAIPFPDRPVDRTRSDVDRTVLDFVDHVWTAFEDCLTDAPRYDEFIDMFRYDIRQLLNAIDYEWLVSTQPELATLTGAYQYGDHNMGLFVYTDIDLMYSPTFERDDLARLRQTVWAAQRLIRIGNWVTTWDRELEEGDYSSGVIVAAFQNGLLDHRQLADHPSEADLNQYVKWLKAHDLEEQFLNEWHDRYADLRSQTASTDSVDLDAFIQGLETVLAYQLAGRK